MPVFCAVPGAGVPGAIWPGAPLTEGVPGTAVFCAVPGLMVPGAIWPGQPVTVPVYGPAVFTGSTVYVYPQYCNLADLETLVAVPAHSYFLRVVGGDPGLPPIPGDGRWYWNGPAAEEDMELVLAAVLVPEVTPAETEAREARHRSWFRRSNTGGGPLHGRRARP